MAAVRDHVDASYFYTAFHCGGWPFRKPAEITIARTELLAVFVNYYCVPYYDISRRRVQLELRLLFLLGVCCCRYYSYPG